MIEDIEDWLATQEAYDLFADIIAQRDQRTPASRKPRPHPKYRKKNKFVRLVRQTDELDLFLTDADLP